MTKQWRCNFHQNTHEFNCKYLDGQPSLNMVQKWFRETFGFHKVPKVSNCHNMMQINRCRKDPILNSNIWTRNDVHTNRQCLYYIYWAYLHTNYFLLVSTLALALFTFLLSHRTIQCYCQPICACFIAVLSTLLRPPSRRNSDLPPLRPITLVFSLPPSLTVYPLYPETDVSL